MIDYERLKGWPIPEARQTYGTRETILYGLGIGCGTDPTDGGELSYVYENGLKAFPSMALVLGYPGFWLRDPGTGVDWRRILHGEQQLVLHQELPPAASVVGRSRVLEVYDKGAGRDALLVSTRDVLDEASGNLLATSTSTLVLRGAGGFGGAASSPSAASPLPDRPPDHTVSIATSAQAALIYRLSGDLNPLHADPAAAAQAGFPKPILHGLCTFGVASRALVGSIGGGDPDSLREVSARFSAPVYPGETIVTDIWTKGRSAQFRCHVQEREQIVLTNGSARFG